MRWMSTIDRPRDFDFEDPWCASLETVRWPERVRCRQCGSARISRFSTKESTRKRIKEGVEMTVRVPARRLYQCLACKHQFTATSGTIFHGSHLSLEKWFQAIALLADARQGVSAKQLQQRLGVAYKTAWYLRHRIRAAMQEEPGLLMRVVDRMRRSSPS